MFTHVILTTILQGNIIPNLQKKISLSYAKKLGSMSRFTPNVLDRGWISTRVVQLKLMLLTTVFFTKKTPWKEGACGQCCVYHMSIQVLSITQVPASAQMETLPGMLKYPELPQVPMSRESLFLNSQETLAPSLMEHNSMTQTAQN